jgi:tRNA(Ile)-lysidine synthase
MESTPKKRKSRLSSEIESFIRKEGLFDPGARILIGVSGGPDSMALLSLLTGLRPRWDLDLRVLYCHHGLRAAADGEEAFVQAWAKKLGCPFFARKLSVREFQKETGKSLQEAARELRYQAFEDYAKQENMDRVALAHTANDQAEEVLIGLIRGAGLGGLAGMPVHRGPFIRPLIRTYRPEILDYLKAENIPYQEDASNQDFRYLRARVRHHLLPELEKYSPNIIGQLNQTTQLLQEDEAYLQEKVEGLKETVISFSDHTVTLDRAELAALPQALASRLIQKALVMGLGSLHHVRAVHILSILKAGNGGKGRLPLPDGWWARWDQEKIEILPCLPVPKPADHFYHLIKKPTRVRLETGDSLTFKKIKASSESFKPPGGRDLAMVDFDKLTWPLLIRNRRPGDRFRPLGMTGTKKVSRVLMDRKIPQALRSRIPLVFSGGEIVWIGGVEIGQSFCRDGRTSRILEIVYERGKGL